MGTKYEQYRRKQIAELRPYELGESLPEFVSISQADKDAGSPKEGDMIARNPKNHDDQWLVARNYFEDNFEPLAIPLHREQGEEESEHRKEPIDFNTVEGKLNWVLFALRKRRLETTGLGMPIRLLKEAIDMLPHPSTPAGEEERKKIDASDWDEVCETLWGKLCLEGILSFSKEGYFKFTDDLFELLFNAKHTHPTQLSLEMEEAIHVPVDELHRIQSDAVNYMRSTPNNDKAAPYCDYIEGAIAEWKRANISPSPQSEQAGEKYGSKMVEALNKFLKEQPEEAKRIWKEVEAMNIQGPTVDEYFTDLLNYYQDKCEHLTALWQAASQEKGVRWVKASERLPEDGRHIIRFKEGTRKFVTLEDGKWIDKMEDSHEWYEVEDVYEWLDEAPRLQEAAEWEAQIKWWRELYKIEETANDNCRKEIKSLTTTLSLIHTLAFADHSSVEYNMEEIRKILNKHEQTTK